MEWRIPLSDLDYGPEEEAAVQRVLAGRWLSMGPEVEAFEQEFAAATGARHALAACNATAALHLALLALRVGPGDEIIQPAINFVALANMTLAAGARPVFGDILSIEEPTLDPIQVEQLITPRTKAVVIMHYGGYPGRMAEITDVCARHHVAVVEDACHAPSVIYQNARQQPPHGRVVGALAQIACFSFFGNKNLSTGEGGMVVTDDDGLAATVRRLRSHGMSTLTWDRHRGHASTYDVTCPGYNYRLDEIRATLGRVQLQRLRAGNARRRELTALYHRLLDNVPGLTVPFAGWPWDFAGHLMPIVARDVAHRARIVDALKQQRIQTSLHYPPIPTFSAFKEFSDNPTPISQAYGERVITLPLFPKLSNAQVESIAAIIRAA